jgi:hypothetical protein
MDWDENFDVPTPSTWLRSVGTTPQTLAIA